nr:hypothetical protein [Tanacetum cinerariifolium]
MEIVLDDGDEVLIEATPISSRSSSITDYKIHKEGKKNYFKIIRADGNSHVYQTFKKIFKNFNREDLEVLWAIVKDRFKKEKPVDDMDNILFRTLKTMFEHHVEDTIWKYQYELAKVKNWKLFESCRVYCITMQTSSESRPPMLNKESYVPWPSRLLWYAKSRLNGRLIHNSILNGPYVRRIIPEPGDANRDVNVTETFHEQTDDELSEKELKQIKADDQAIIQEKKAKLFNEWERFTSNEGELIESYYHCFLKLMNDLKRNKHFPEKIASNLKFLNNLQPEWSRHVTIVHQTKDLYIADYTQLYDFLKYNQKEVDELKAEQLAKIQDPFALMANSNNPYASPAPHQDQS